MFALAMPTKINNKTNNQQTKESDIVMPMTLPINAPPFQLVRSLVKNFIHNLNMEKINAHIYN